MWYLCRPKGCLSFGDGEKCLTAREKALQWRHSDGEKMLRTRELSGSDQIPGFQFINFADSDQVPSFLCINMPEYQVSPGKAEINILEYQVGPGSPN